MSHTIYAANGACANACLLTKRKKEVMLELTTIDANNGTVNLSQCMLSCRPFGVLPLKDF